MIEIPRAFSRATSSNSCSASCLARLARGLVHDQDPGVLGQRLGDLGELPVGRAQVADPGSGIDVDLHLLEDLPCLVAGLAGRG